jgi:molecular chaperone DnaK (HSP70)
LVYGLETESVNSDKEINVVVCDIGGGTTDVSLVNISDGVFSVLASAGNSHLGGCDFDNEIMHYVIQEFMKSNNIDTTYNENEIEISQCGYKLLKTSVEKAKIKLSRKNKANISVKQFYNNIDLNVTISQEILYNICNELAMLCLLPLENVLKSSNITKNEIDELIFVGGMTKMPMIQDIITKYVGIKPKNHIDPDKIVAIGASIQAYILLNKEDAFSQNITLLDVTALSLGVAVMNNIMDVVVPKNTTIPTKITKTYTNQIIQTSFYTITPHHFQPGRLK